MIQENKVQSIEAKRRDNLLRLLQSNGVPVGSACGGHGLCASCKVRVTQGEKNLSPPNDIEVELKDRNRIPDTERIACQCEVLGDIEITTSYW